jgi:hypothetical protein
MEPVLFFIFFFEGTLVQQIIILNSKLASNWIFLIGKVKVKFTLEQAMKAQRGSRGIPSSTSLLDGGWTVDATQRPLYPRERNPVPIV